MLCAGWQGPRVAVFPLLRTAGLTKHLKQHAVGAVFNAIVVDTFKRIPFLMPDTKKCAALRGNGSPNAQSGREPDAAKPKTPCRPRPAAAASDEWRDRCMSHTEKKIVIIAGSNGAGKTTFALEVPAQRSKLPLVHQC